MSLGNVWPTSKQGRCRYSRWLGLQPSPQWHWNIRQALAKATKSVSIHHSRSSQCHSRRSPQWRHPLRVGEPSSCAVLELGKGELTRRLAELPLKEICCWIGKYKANSKLDLWVPGGKAVFHPERMCSYRLLGCSPIRTYLLCCLYVNPPRPPSEWSASTLEELEGLIHHFDRSILKLIPKVSLMKVQTETPKFDA